MVVQIRVTSPDFETASGVSTDSGVAQIQKAYPLAHRDRGWESKLPSRSDQNLLEGWVDQGAGIAFELRAGATAHPTKRGSCIAIHVFSRGSQPVPMGSFNE